MNDFSEKQSHHKTVEKKHRVFFALWLEDDTRQQIVKTFEQSSQYKMKGRVLRSDNLHITLHFIGSVSNSKMDCMHKLAQSVDGTAFNLVLDHYGYFYKPKVLWIGLKEVPSALAELHEELGKALAECDYQMEHRPYAPHVTLMRKLTRPGELEKIEPVNWAVKDFVLVESIPVADGVHYEVRQRYPLK